MLHLVFVLLKRSYLLFIFQLMRTSTPKKSLSSSGLPALSSELFEAHPASDQESGEDDKDYYFSDE